MKIINRSQLWQVIGDVNSLNIYNFNFGSTVRTCLEYSNYQEIKYQSLLIE